MDYDSGISEIRRVLKPDGLTLHGFPGRYRFIEPHVFVPAATLVRWKAWLSLWAHAGIRNRFQLSLSAPRVAEENYKYLKNRTSYPTDGAVRKYFLVHFEEVHFIEREVLLTKGGILAFAAKIPFGPLAVRLFRNRMVLAKGPLPADRKGRN